MRDDLYILNADGWAAGKEIVVTKKTKNAKEWDGLIIPKSLVSERFFPELVEAVKVATAKAEAASAEFDQFVESEIDKGEESDILERDDDEWKVCADKELKQKLKTSETVRRYFSLKKMKSDAAAELKDAEQNLDQATERKYPKLTNGEIQGLLLDDKWFAALDGSIMGLFDATLRRFASSLTLLASRYAQTLPELEAKVAASQDKVHAVLREMGFNC